MTTTATTTNTNNNTLAALAAAINSGVDYAAELTAAARCIAYGVINKIYNASGNPHMLRVRAEITRGAACHDAGTIGTDSGTGYDIVQTAAAELLTAAAEQRQREPGCPVDYDRPYNARRLDRRVIIRADDSAAWRDVATTPRRDVYQAVRRYIADNGNISIDPRNGYTYIDDVATDGADANAAEIVYYRCGKYADIGGYVVDANGRNTVYTAHGDARDEMRREADIITRLNLTERERLILHYRLQGCGYRAIATRLGVTDGTIKKACARMRDKASRAGYKPAE